MLADTERLVLLEIDVEKLRRDNETLRTTLAETILRLRAKMQAQDALINAILETDAVQNRVLANLASLLKNAA